MLSRGLIQPSRGVWLRALPRTTEVPYPSGMTDSDQLGTLRLVSGAGGAAVGPLVVRADTDRVLIGRSHEAGWQLPDPQVSRRHAVLYVVGRAMMLRDLNSRHGTVVNGSPLAAGGETPLKPGDTVQLGNCRCTMERRAGVSPAQTIADDPSSVTVVSRASVGGLARVRLDALIGCATRLARAGTREEAASLLLASLATLPECARASVYRPLGADEYELVAAADGLGTPTPSRSLLHEASAGKLVQLVVDGTLDDRSHSLIQMRVQSAVCVPIRVAGQTDCLLYVDTRDGERPIDADAIGFCDAVAAIAGLAIERILSEEMADRRRQIELDLRSARDAQRMLFPAPQGRSGDLGYVFESIPGRYVGGDLFDLFPLDHGCTGFFLGDAVGKGAGAGVLMVATQTLLRNHLESGRSLGQALTLTNRGLAVRSQAGKFVTLIAGIWNPADRALELVDAGHGMALFNRGSGFERIVVSGDIPLGISDATEYTAESLRVESSCRLVLCSDGVGEQPDLGGEQFGPEGTEGALRGSDSPESDVRRIVQAVRDHAGTDFSDDLTVASISMG